MALIIPIDDPGDPRLAAYREVRERDLVGRRGHFIAEGQVVIEKLAAAGRHPIRSLLVAAKRLAALEGLIARLGPDVPVYAADQAVMDAVVGFPIHRGLLAEGERVEVPADRLLAGLTGPALVVGLAGIANHDNMGGLFRNAAAFGADAVFLADDCCDPLYRKAIRVSVGAALTLPFARCGAPEAMIGRLQAEGFAVVTLSPGATETLAELEPQPRVAVVFGAEGPGLPADILARTRSVRIPMAGGFDSLNVATASGIVLHQLVEGRSKNLGT